MCAAARTRGAAPFPRLQPGDAHRLLLPKPSHAGACHGHRPSSTVAVEGSWAAPGVVNSVLPTPHSSSAPAVTSLHRKKINSNKASRFPREWLPPRLCRASESRRGGHGSSTYTKIIAGAVDRRPSRLSCSSFRLSWF